jgi:hypothetical protein
MIPCTVLYSSATDVFERIPFHSARKRVCSMHTSSTPVTEYSSTTGRYCGHEYEIISLTSSRYCSTRFYCLVTGKYYSTALVEYVLLRYVVCRRALAYCAFTIQKLKSQVTEIGAVHHDESQSKDKDHQDQRERRCRSY